MHHESDRRPAKLGLPILALIQERVGSVGFRARWILLDFRLMSPPTRARTDFACWIFVGFRGRLNMRSHVQSHRKWLLTCDFALWAVTGSNRRPLRCKR